MTLYPASPDGLNNINIGGPENHRVGVAFKAKFSSPLVSVRYYMMWGGAGYAGGTLGRFRYELFSDSSGKPGSSIAISVGYQIEDPQYPQPTNNKGGFPLIAFPNPTLKAGLWYHFIITNIDLTPKVNFSSFNAMLAKGGVNPDPDSFIEYDSNGSGWVKYTTMVAEPFGVFYANGELQGNGGYQLDGQGNMLCGKAYGFGKLC